MAGSDVPNPAVLSALADAMIAIIEEEGGDVLRFGKHPLGEALIQQTAQEQKSPEEFREMVRKILILAPHLRADPGAARKLPHPPMS